MFKFPKTLHFAISDLTAIPKKRPADFNKVGQLQHPNPQGSCFVKSVRLHDLNHVIKIIGIQVIKRA